MESIQTKLLGGISLDACLPYLQSHLSHMSTSFVVNCGALVLGHVHLSFSGRGEELSRILENKCGSGISVDTLDIFGPRASLLSRRAFKADGC